ncbi:MAG: phosphate ABC transporter permease subunit PstC [Lachnospiraceae bacterium]
MENVEMLSQKELKIEGQMERNKVKDMFEKIVETIFFLCAMVAVISVIALIAFVFWKGLKPFFGADAYPFLDFITGTKWAPGSNTYGILHMIVASVLATMGAICIGVPVGLLTAVFLAEIAPDNMVKIVTPAVELLAGIPSVLYGVFGVGVIVPAIKSITPKVQGQSLLAVIIVLTIMILPTIITLSVTALKAVPKSYKEGAYGLGATKMQMIFKTVVPAAKSGILSATVLAIGRAIGETMAVMLVAGNPESGMPGSIWDKVRLMTTNIAIEMGYASGRQSEMLFATGVVLFIFIMIVNLTLIRLTAGKKDEK